jgi:hypothetical protein
MALALYCVGGELFPESAYAVQRHFLPSELNIYIAATNNTAIIMDCGVM